MAASSTPFELPILHDDGLCLVVDKPGGVLTQAPADIDSVEARLKDWFQEQNPSARKSYLGVPHRLDRPASGAMVFSRNEQGTRHLSQQFQERQVEKLYWCLVAGDVAGQSGLWTDTMRKVPEQARSETVAADAPGAQLAVLRYRVLGRFAGTSLLEIRLETGRTHQIRLQTATRGHPILGDELYGSQRRFGPETWDQRARWIALHARYLAFQHPTISRPIQVTAPLYAFWQEFLAPFADQEPRIAEALAEMIPPPSG